MKDYPPQITNTPGLSCFGRVPAKGFRNALGGAEQGGITPPFLEIIKNAVLLSLTLIVVLALFEVWR